MRVKCKIAWMVCGMLGACGLAAVHAETLYQTGFEADNEPFETFLDGPLSYQEGWKSRGQTVVSTENPYTGSQSISPGPGNDVYGVGIVKSFEFPEKTEFWVDFMVNSDSFGGFVWVSGTNAASGEVAFPAVFFYITSNGINIMSGQEGVPMVTTAMKMEGWHRLTLRLNFADKSYDIYTDGALMREEIPFYTSPDFGQAETLANVTLGGGVSPESCIFYDDLSVGTTSPLP